jgi:hypothetical protein
LTHAIEKINITEENMILVEPISLQENLEKIKIKNTFKYRHLSIDEIKNKLFVHNRISGTNT